MLFSKFVFDLLDKLMYPSCNFNSIKGITIEKSIVYDKGCPEDCKADLYYKKGKDGKYPVVLNIHGGGFVAGDKKYRPRFSKQLADRNLFVMSINYTLCPKSKFPEFIIQCANALKWIGENSEKYNLDLENVLVTGDSAGAYISSYLGILQANKELRELIGVEDFSPKIKGLILYCGPYQVESLLTKKIMLNLQAEIGSAFLNVPKEDIINIDRLRDHKFRNVLNIPPFVNKDFPTTFLTYAVNDFLCPEQGEPFMKVLEENGVKFKFHCGNKKKDVHCYHLFWHSKNGRAAMQGTFEFIEDIISNKI